MSFSPIRTRSSTGSTQQKFYCHKCQKMSTVIEGCYTCYVCGTGFVEKTAVTSEAFSSLVNSQLHGRKAFLSSPEEPRHQVKRRKTNQGGNRVKKVGVLPASRGRPPGRRTNQRRNRVEELEISPTSRLPRRPPGGRTNQRGNRVEGTGTSHMSHLPQHPPGDRINEGGNRVEETGILLPASHLPQHPPYRRTYEGGNRVEEIGIPPASRLPRHPPDGEESVILNINVADVGDFGPRSLAFDTGLHRNLMETMGQARSSMNSEEGNLSSNGILLGTPPRLSSLEFSDTELSLSSSDVIFMDIPSDQLEIPSTSPGQSNMLNMRPLQSSNTHSNEWEMSDSSSSQCSTSDTSSLQSSMDEDDSSMDDDSSYFSTSSDSDLSSGLFNSDESSLSSSLFFHNSESSLEDFIVNDDDNNVFLIEDNINIIPVGDVGEIIGMEHGQNNEEQYQQLQQGEALAMEEMAQIWQVEAQQGEHQQQLEPGFEAEQHNQYQPFDIDMNQGIQQQEEGNAYGYGLELGDFGLGVGDVLGLDNVYQEGGSDHSDEIGEINYGINYDELYGNEYYPPPVLHSNNISISEEFVNSVLIACGFSPDNENGNPSLASLSQAINNAGGASSIGNGVMQVLEFLKSFGAPPLPPDEIKELKCTRVTEEYVKMGLSCRICVGMLVVGENVIVLRCEHLYHEDCIINWMKVHATCPLCRVVLRRDGKSEFDDFMTFDEDDDSATIMATLSNRIPANAAPNNVYS